MKTLSLWQPWASLIATGFKIHETRHWPTSRQGPLAIHAALRRESDIDPWLNGLCEFALGRDWRDTVPRGAVVAVARLTDCVPTASFEGTGSITFPDLLAGNFESGRFAFRLEQVRALLEPIPLRGQKSFFEWDAPHGIPLGPELDHAVQAQRFKAWCEEQGRFA